jgi:hypothetical protein
MTANWRWWLPQARGHLSRPSSEIPASTFHAVPSPSLPPPGRIHAPRYLPLHGTSIPGSSPSAACKSRVAPANRKPATIGDRCHHLRTDAAHSPSKVELLFGHDSPPCMRPLPGTSYSSGEPPKSLIFFRKSLLQGPSVSLYQPILRIHRPRRFPWGRESWHLKNAPRNAGFID